MTVNEFVTTLRYAYDNSKLKSYITDIQNAKNKIGGALDGAAAAPLANANAQLGEVRNKLFSLRNIVMGYVATVAGGAVTQIADDWAGVSGRVKLATESAEEHKHALSEIYAIAQRTNQAYTAAGDLFQKVQRNKADLGLSTDDTLNLTEIIGQTMSIGGGDAGAQQAALMQLGQALGAGALRGDELNSIIEQAPRLAQAIADSFGVSVGQLKDMGKNGKLTSKELAQGLLKQAGKIQAEFDQMPKTFSGSMTKLRNALGRFISFAVNDVLKLGNVFAKLADWIEKNINLVLILAVSAIGTKLLFALKATNGQLKLMIANVTKAFAPFLAVAAALTVVGLSIEDIYYWTQGYGSVTTALVGRYEMWAYKFDQIGRSASMLWASIKGLINDVGRLIGIDVSSWFPDFKSWGDLATATLQYIIDGTNNLIKVLRSLTKIARMIVKGEFAEAWIEAGKDIDLLSAKFLPFYAVAFTVLGAIGGLLKWVLSPLRLLRFGLKGVGKSFSFIGSVIKFLFSPLTAFLGGLKKVWAVGVRVIGVFSRWGKSIRRIWFLLRAVGSYLGVFKAIGWVIGKGILAFDVLITVLKTASNWIIALSKFLSGALISAVRTAGIVFISIGKRAALAFSFLVNVLKTAGGWIITLSKFLGGALISALRAVGMAFIAVGKRVALAFVTNPIGLLIAAVAVAVYLIVKYWDEIKATAILAWNLISVACSQAWDNIHKKAVAIWDSIEKYISDKANTVGRLWDSITMLFSNAWENAIKYVTSKFEGLIPDWVKNLFSDGATVTVNGQMPNIAGDTMALAGQLAQYSTSMQQNQTINNNQVINVNGSQNPTATAREVNKTISGASKSSHRYQMTSIESGGG